MFVKKLTLRPTYVGNSRTIGLTLLFSFVVANSLRGALALAALPVPPPVISELRPQSSSLSQGPASGNMAQGDSVNWWDKAPVNQSTTQNSPVVLNGDGSVAPLVPVEDFATTNIDKITHRENRAGFQQPLLRSKWTFFWALELRFQRSPVRLTG